MPFITSPCPPSAVNITDELQGISIKVESKPKSFVTSKIGLLKEPAF